MVSSKKLSIFRDVKSKAYGLRDVPIELSQSGCGCNGENNHFSGRFVIDKALSFFYSGLNKLPGLVPGVLMHTLCMTHNGNRNCRDDFETVDGACKWMQECNNTYPGQYSDWSIDGQGTGLCFS